MSTPFAGTAALTEFWAKVKAYVTNALTSKQDTLVSGTNIKTINNESILGSGNITIQGGGGSNPAVDYVIEQSSTSSGSYRKWSSGKLECWVWQNITTTINTSWGGTYRNTPVVTGVSWPVAFNTLDHCYTTNTGRDGDMAWVACASIATVSKAPDFYLLRGASLTSAKQFYIHHYGVGTWGTGETINVADETSY